MARFNGRRDNFGRQLMNVPLTDRKGRGFYKGIIDINGVRLVVEFNEQSEVKSDAKTGHPQRWLRVVQAQNKGGSRGGSYSNSQGGYGGQSYASNYGGSQGSQFRGYSNNGQG
jgi:hypothetical protein